MPRDGREDGRGHIDTVGIITGGQTPRLGLDRVFRRRLSEANLPIWPPWTDLSCVPLQSCATLLGQNAVSYRHEVCGRRSANPMRLHLLRHAPTRDQLQEMLEAQGSYIKLAVDVAQGIVVGGGEYHADCEEVLLEQGSRQEDIWGADWYPDRRTVTFGALINIRPRQDNRSMEVQNPALRARIEHVVRAVFVGTTP